MSGASRRRLRIGYLYPHWELGREATAMDVLGLRLAESMAGSHEVTVYVRGRNRHGDARQVEGVTYHLLPTRFDGPVSRAMERVTAIVPGELGRPERPIVSTKWAFLGYATGAARAVGGHGSDIAHVQIYDQFVPLVRKHAPDTKIVLHMHDHSQFHRAREAVKADLKAADLVVGCSQFIARQAQARFPELSERIVAIPNGTQVPETPPKPRAETDEVEILFTGRLSPEKGVHVLLEAFGEVHRRHPKTRLTVIGPTAPAPKTFVDPFDEDPLFDGMRHLFEGGGYAEHVRGLLGGPAAEAVTFAGGMSHGYVEDYYDRSDILAFPSVWNEPFGLPVIEAMARGLPVVATRRGAFPETVADGETGLLVEAGDVGALAEALLRLVEDRELREQMGRAGWERVREQFGWEGYVAEWERAYAGLVGR